MRKQVTNLQHFDGCLLNTWPPGEAAQYPEMQYKTFIASLLKGFQTGRFSFSILLQSVLLEEIHCEGRGKQTKLAVIIML